MKITRTITTYTYAFGAYDVGSGTVKNIFREVHAKPLGPRLLAKRLAEINDSSDATFISLGFEEETAIYAMELTSFLEHAKRVEAGEEDVVEEG